MKIVNLTQHNSTHDQQEQGLFDLSEATALKTLLTFNSLPTKAEIRERAESIAQLAQDTNAPFAMIGGAGYLMASLESALIAKGITPLHAFSQRVSVEKHNEDGTVSKENIFKHVGFIGLD